MITTNIMFKVGIDMGKNFLEAENVFKKLVTFIAYSLHLVWLN